MSRLSALRLSRWLRQDPRVPRWPSLEELIDTECEKTAEGWRLARWIVPLTGVVIGAGVFGPLAVFGHPGFWIGVIAAPLLAGIFGVISHWQARQLSDAHRQLRLRCHKAAERLNRFENLTGAQPTLAPGVGELLDRAAKAWLAAVRPASEKRSLDPVAKTRDMLDASMAQMMELAVISSHAAQEAALQQGWAQELTAEMEAASASIGKLAASGLINGLPSTLTAELSATRAHLEEMSRAAQELDDELEGRTPLNS
jgi:hypothetical protein